MAIKEMVLGECPNCGYRGPMKPAIQKTSMAELKRKMKKKAKVRM